MHLVLVVVNVMAGSAKAIKKTPIYEVNFILSYLKKIEKIQESIYKSDKV